jgi:hypothetical protein
MLLIAGINPKQFKSIKRIINTTEHGYTGCAERYSGYY